MFKGKRLSNLIAKVEDLYDKGVQKLGDYIERKEDEYVERKITREAEKMLREADHSLRVLKRAAEINARPRVRV